MLKRTLRRLHRWLGLALALPLLVQGLTGVVLTLEPVWPDLGLVPDSDVRPISANAIVAAARGVAPAGMHAVRYAPGDAGQPARVSFADAPRGPASVVRVDPGTATALGPATRAPAALDWVKRLHNTLLLPEYGGRQLAGWFGVGLLLLLLMGIPLWWPAPGQMRAGLTVPRRARGARLYRALHGAMGAWLVALLLATSVTGIVQGFPQTARRVLGVAEPARPGAAGPARPDGAAAPPDLDAAIRLAEGAMPGFVPRLVLLPEGRGPIRLLMTPPGESGARVTRTVLVDGRATRVLSAQGAPDGGEAVMRWVHDLHEGQGLGPVWRGLTVVTGLALPLFGVTGGLLWLARRRKPVRSRV